MNVVLTTSRLGKFFDLLAGLRSLLEVLRDREPRSSPRDYRACSQRDAEFQAAFEASLYRSVDLLLSRQTVPVDCIFPLRVSRIDWAIPDRAGWRAEVY